MPPASGQARVMGFDAAREGTELRQFVGYMPEHDCLLTDMTGIGLVSYMGRVSGLDRGTAMSRARERSSSPWS